MPATVLTTDCSFFFKNLIHVTWAVLFLPYLSFPIYETFYETLRATHSPASYRISHPPNHSPPHMTSLLPFVLCHLFCILLHQFPPSPANHPTKSTSPFFTQTCYLPTLLFYLVSNERTSKMDILCLLFCIHSLIFRCSIFLPIHFRYPHYCCMGFNLFHFDGIEGCEHAWECTVYLPNLPIHHLFISFSCTSFWLSSIP